MTQPSVHSHLVKLNDFFFRASFLFSNSLDGTMPHQIWAMPALESLDLKENSVFMGFKNIDQAKKLEVLYISDIDIDSIEGIGKAPALTEL